MNCIVMVQHVSGLLGSSGPVFFLINEIIQFQFTVYMRRKENSCHSNSLLFSFRNYKLELMFSVTLACELVRDLHLLYLPSL